MRNALWITLAMIMPAWADKPRDFGWHSNYETAKAEAKKSGKPMFVVFRCEP